MFILQGGARNLSRPFFSERGVSCIIRYMSKNYVNLRLKTRLVRCWMGPKRFTTLSDEGFRGVHVAVKNDLFLTLFLKTMEGGTAVYNRGSYKGCFRGSYKGSYDLQGVLQDPLQVIGPLIGPSKASLIGTPIIDCSTPLHGF